MNRNDKRASICRLSFLPIEQATVNDFLGQTNIQVRGTFTDIPISSGEWTETTDPVNGVEQELNAVVTDTSFANLNDLRTLLSQNGLLLLTLTNGERRVAGTKEFPVLVSTELSGTPASLQLSFRRSSPEPSKNYSSF